MSFHSFLMFRTKGDVLLERMYEAGVSRDAFVESVVQATRRDWEGATVQRVAIVAGATAVFFRLGDLVFVLSGVRDYEELVIGETLRCLVELVIAQCDSKEGVNENEFLAQHDRISLLLDHVIRDGLLEHTGGACLSALLAAAPETVTTAVLQQRELERVSVPGHVLPTLVAKAGKQPRPGKLPERPRVNSTVLVKGTKK